MLGQAASEAQTQPNVEYCCMVRRMAFLHHGWLSLMAKVLAGWALGLVYALHYGQGDTLVLFAEANKLAAIAWQDAPRFARLLLSADEAARLDLQGILSVGNARAVFAIKLIALPALLSGGQYWLCSAWLSAWSWSGCWALATVLMRRFPHQRWSILLGCCYWPGLLFWTSGILKEALLMGILGWAMVIGLVFWSRRRWLSRLVLLSLLGLLLWAMLKLKFYYAGMFGAGLAAWLLAGWVRQWAYGARMAVMLISFGMVLLFGTLLSPHLHLSRLLNAILLNRTLMIEQSDHTHNLIGVPSLAPTPLSFLRHAPAVGWQAFFRPLVWEQGPWLKRLAALESLAFATLLLVALALRLRRPGLLKPTDDAGLLAVLALLLAALTILLLAFAAPNLGNLIRYKAPLWPLLIITLGAYPEAWIREKYPYL